MFVFEFVRTLFKLRADTPAREPLFQLPPRYGTPKITHNPAFILANVYFLLMSVFRFASPFTISLMKPLVPAPDHSAYLVIHCCPLGIFLYINES